MSKQCESCPESIVLFDDTGYHGCKPDSNSPTCKKCIKESDLLNVYEVRQMLQA